MPLGKLPPSALQDSCAPLTAPRGPQAPHSRHLLMALLLRAVCAVMCGAEGWEDLEAYGKAHAEGGADLRDLPYGLPGHATLRRVVSQLAPEALTRCGIAWTAAWRAASAGAIISRDGTRLRQAVAQAPAPPAIPRGRAWGRATRLGLGPRQVEEQSQEITAMPQRLARRDGQGAGGTSDALGCQQAIATTMPDRGADAVLALKANPTTLSEEVPLCCEEAKAPAGTDVDHASHATGDGAQGRMAPRRSGLPSPSAWWGARASWAQVPSMGMVASRRAGGETGQSETRYVRTSLPAQGVRQHGGIEPSLHGVLDVAFDADACRIRQDKGAQTCASLRPMALHLLRRAPHQKRGIKARRQRAGWDRDDLVQILTGQAKCAYPGPWAG